MFEGAHFCIRCGTPLGTPDEPAPARRTTTMRPVADAEAAPAGATSLWALPKSSSQVADSFEAALARAALETPSDLDISESEPIELTDIDEGFEALEPKDRAEAENGRNQGDVPDTRRHESMAEFSRDEVLRRVRMKQSLKRAGMNGIDLSSQALEGVSATPT
jgi:hypothetical protein